MGIGVFGFDLERLLVGIPRVVPLAGLLQHVAALDPDGRKLRRQFEHGGVSLRSNCPQSVVARLIRAFEQRVNFRLLGRRVGRSFIDRRFVRANLLDGGAHAFNISLFIFKNPAVLSIVKVTILVKPSLQLICNCWLF